MIIINKFLSICFPSMTNCASQFYKFQISNEYNYIILYLDFVFTRFTLTPGFSRLASLVVFFSPHPHRGAYS